MAISCPKWGSIEINLFIQTELFDCYSCRDQHAGPVSPISRIPKLAGSSTISPTATALRNTGKIHPPSLICNCKNTVHVVKYFSANGGAGGDSPSKKRRGQESQYPAPKTPVTSPNHNLGPAAAAPFSVISPSRIPTIHNKKSSLDSSSHVGGLSERPRKNSLDNELSSGLVTNSILFCYLITIKDRCKKCISKKSTVKVCDSCC